MRWVLLALIFLTALPLPSRAADEKPSPTEKKEKKAPEPIGFPKSVMPPDEPLLKTAVESPPDMARNVEIYAKKKSVDYFLRRPGLAYRILDDYGTSPVTIDKGEAGAWEMTASSGAFYTLKKLWEKDRAYLVRFGFFYRAPIGIGIKLSGAGAVAFRFRTKPDSESVFLDYDIYFAPGGLPLDKVAEYLPVQKLMIVDDLRQVAEAFAELIETAEYDPEMMADDMEWSEDLFSDEEVESFRKAFGVGKR